MKLSPTERDQLIKQVSQVSGIAQYALKAKMTDEQLIQASLAQSLEILAIIKDANNFNRYQQGLKTREANEKLKVFLNPQHSELLNAGKWLLNALSKSGNDRKQALLEKDLVHKNDYNLTIQGMRDDVESIQEVSQEAITEAEITISDLQKRIDTLRGQLSKIQNYISIKYGQKEWQAIKQTFKLD